MFDKIYPAVWMTLSREQRDHLAHVFHVARSGVSEVKDQTQVSDGRTIDDLAVITSEKMAEYVGSVEPFNRLWELSVARSHSELHPPVGVIVAREQMRVENLPDSRLTIDHEEKKAKRTTKKQV